MICELRLICASDDGTDRIMSIRRYSTDNPTERTRQLEDLSKTARKWREIGYPVSVIEEDEREALPPESS